MFAADSDKAVARPIGKTFFVHSPHPKLCSNFVRPVHTQIKETIHPNHEPKDDTNIALWKFVFMIRCLFEIIVADANARYPKPYITANAVCDASYDDVSTNRFDESISPERLKYVFFLFILSKNEIFFRFQFVKIW